MKLRLILFILLVVSPVFAAQLPFLKVSSTSNTRIASTSSFEVLSTTKGVLLPRMTTAQRTAIVTGVADKGLIVYDTDLSNFYYWDGTAWQLVPGNGITQLYGDVVAVGPGSTVATINGLLRNKLAQESPYRILANDVNGYASMNAALTPNYAIYSDGNGQLAVSTTTNTQISYLSALSPSLGNSIIVTSANGFLINNTAIPAQNVLYTNSLGLPTRSPMTTKGDILVHAGTTTARLPVGTDTYILTADSGTSLGVNWVTPAAAAGLLTAYSDMQNLGISITVASSQWTIALKSKALTDPTASDPVKVSFRNATSATGDYVTRSITSALSITTTLGDTFGHTANVNQYIYLCLIDNAGSPEWALIGSRYDLDEGSVISTTVLNSNSDNWATMYSTTARSNVAFKIIARLKSNQTVAGALDNAPTEISFANNGIYTWPMQTSVASTTYSYTFSGFGTTTDHQLFSDRHKEFLHVNGSVCNGTVAATQATINFPSGLTIDSSKVGLQFRNYFGNSVLISNSGSLATYTSAGFVPFLIYQANEPNKLFYAFQTTTSRKFASTTGSAIFGSSDCQAIDFKVPITEWRSY